MRDEASEKEEYAVTTRIFALQLYVGERNIEIALLREERDNALDSSGAFKVT